MEGAVALQTVRSRCRRGGIADLGRKRPPGDLRCDLKRRCRRRPQETRQRGGGQVARSWYQAHTAAARTMCGRRNGRRGRRAVRMRRCGKAGSSVGKVRTRATTALQHYHSSVAWAAGWKQRGDSGGARRCAGMLSWSRHSVRA
jgi:hypothetical protein